MPNLAESGYRAFPLLEPLTIGAAVASTTTEPVTGLVAMEKLLVQATFVYGAGGTNVTAYVQTSLDAGVTWIDVMAFQFTTASAQRIHTVVGFGTANYTPTDGTLTVNTVKDGVLGDRLRLKYTSTGTYTGVTTLAVHAMTRGA